MPTAYGVDQGGEGIEQCGYVANRWPWHEIIQHYSRDIKPFAAGNQKPDICGRSVAPERVVLRDRWSFCVRRARRPPLEGHPASSRD